MNEETGKAYAKQIKDKIKKDKEERKKKKEEKEKDRNGVEAELETFESETVYGSSELSEINEIVSEEKETTDGNTKADLVNYANKYQIGDRKYIPNYQYFMHTELMYGNNNGTQYGIVAAQLLLSYNNWANDGRLIKDGIKYSDEDFLFDRSASDYLKPYSGNMMNSTYDVSEVDGVTTLYEKLLGYIPHTDGTNRDSVMDGINDYLDDYYEVTDGSKVEMEIFKIDSNAKEQIEIEVNAGRPLIVGIDFYETSESEKMVGHAVVVYGYQKLEVDGVELDGYVANMGWRSINRSNT